MATLTNPYLDKSYQSKLDSLTKQYEAAQANNVYQNQLALATQKQTNRASANAYQQAINPYGIQAEQRAQGGLTNSGVANRMNTNAYRSLQQNYGNASGTYLNTLANNNNSLLQSQYQTEADKLSALGDYNTNIYDEYWRLKQQEYQEGRDAVADKQWERDYKLRKKQLR